MFNLGNNTPVIVNNMITTLEQVLHKKAKKNFLPMQPGDVKQTYADIESSKKLLKYKPETDIKIGLVKFTNWFKEYKNIK